jgi:two-component system LytT family response regulator
LRILIADDEPLARSRIRHLLAAHVDARVVGECVSAPEMTTIVQHEKPDLVMLDIEMAGTNGLRAFADIPADQRPAVIFTTAHDEFAVRAFDLDAIDYLIKPFDQDRFDRALERARRVIGSAPAEPVVPGRRRDRFAVKRRGEIIFLKTEQIDWIQAEANYSRIHTGDVSYLLRESMQSLDDTLDPEMFVRVHRSAIINIDRVQKVIASSDGAYSIVLTTGAAVPLGPSYRTRLEQLIGQKL